MGPSFELLQRALGGPKNTSNQFNQSSIDSLCLKKVCDGDPKMWPPLQNEYFWVNAIFFKHLTWIKVPSWSNMIYLIKKCFPSIHLVFYLDILGKIKGEHKTWPPLHNGYFWVNVIFLKHLTWLKVPFWSHMIYLIKKCFPSVYLVFYLDILGKIKGEQKTWPPLHKIWNYVCLTYLKKDIPILMLYIVFVG